MLYINKFREFSFYRKWKNRLEKIGKKGRFGKQEKFLIDTPGLGDAERNDAIHLVQIGSNLKKKIINLLEDFYVNICIAQH